MLAVYGPSVFTVGRQDWPRHRNALAAPFNKSIMKFVWDESLRQARYVLPQSTMVFPGCTSGLTTVFKPNGAILDL